MPALQGGAVIAHHFLTHKAIRDMAALQGGSSRHSRMGQRQGAPLPASGHAGHGGFVDLLHRLLSRKHLPDACGRGGFRACWCCRCLNRCSSCNRSNCKDKPMHRFNRGCTWGCSQWGVLHMKAPQLLLPLLHL